MKEDGTRIENKGSSRDRCLCVSLRVWLYFWCICKISCDCVSKCVQALFTMCMCLWIDEVSVGKRKQERKEGRRQQVFWQGQQPSHTKTHTHTHTHTHTQNTDYNRIMHMNMQSNTNAGTHTCRNTPKHKCVISPLHTHLYTFALGTRGCSHTHTPECSTFSLWLSKYLFTHTSTRTWTYEQLQ